MVVAYDVGNVYGSRFKNLLLIGICLYCAGDERKQLKGVFLSGSGGVGD